LVIAFIYPFMFFPEIEEKRVLHVTCERGLEVFISILPRVVRIAFENMFYQSF